MIDKPVVMVGVSAAIRDTEAEIRDAAASNAKVLITGESGVGKEIVARLIHQGSTRRGSPLVTINCAGVPDSLVESEMFGHVKGSFTDAYRDKIGWLEQANRGTIFMDEIGEMSLRMQAMLLRFLENGEIQRVGSDARMMRLDVRVITATHRRLIEHVADKSFREDLYYRLNVIHIAVPALRERPEDVPELLTHFTRHFSEQHRMPEPELTQDALSCLMAYRWPGNVRELKNIAERIVLRSSANGRIDVDALPREVREGRPAVASAAGASHGATPAAALTQSLFDRMVVGAESFWSVVHDPFMARDLTRRDVREVVRLGLKHTLGNYKLLVACFSMPPDDYKRFLSFLRKYECHVPFQLFRALPVPAPTVDPGCAVADQP
jgi:transcriptional regulator with PAS, ATPase and Fis domain